MPSLERFFDPQMRKFDANVKPLPGARLYFFENETSTPKVIYQDKQGLLPHENPVIADASGVFPQIFLDGLYRVELRSNKNIPQPGWPIDNIGQDIPVVPFGPWSEINTYNTGEIVTATNGDWYRSISDNNLGNDPLASPSDWEIIPIPVASSFTSDKAYLTWADDGDQISLNVDVPGLTDEIEDSLNEINNNLTINGDLTLTGAISDPNYRIATRTTAKQITNSTTLEEDGELTISNLEPSTLYAVKGFIKWEPGNTDGNGIKLKVGGTISETAISYVSNTLQSSGIGGAANLLFLVSQGTNFFKMPDGSFSVECIIIDGFVETSATDPAEIRILWAQNVAFALSTTVAAGSYISVRKLG